MTARLTFTSARSMEMEVVAEAEGKAIGSRRFTASAFFTYVAIGEDKKAISVPPMKLRTAEEETRFRDGKKRYEARKGR